MADKIKISNDAFVYPMPVVLVGSLINDKPNFMAVSWFSRVNSKPPMAAISIAKQRHTNKGIQEHKQFSINLPDTSLLSKADYCGLVSGKQTDKFKLFSSFYGTLKKAPMIEECPITMACKLEQTIELKSNILFIGKVVNVYTEESFLSNEALPDPVKINPFILTMPDNNYWAMRETLGKAWNMGKRFSPKKKMRKNNVKKTCT